MAEPKTKPTSQNPLEFLQAIEPEQRRKDGLILLQIFEEATGEKAVMWGPSIVGFGLYHYKSERSSHEGDWPLVGFSPRKQNLTLYIMDGTEDYQDLLKKLGKHKTSKACLYINKLSDIDVQILARLVKECFRNNKRVLV